MNCFCFLPLLLPPPQQEFWGAAAPHSPSSASRNSSRPRCRRVGEPVCAPPQVTDAARRSANEPTNRLFPASPAAQAGQNKPCSAKCWMNRRHRASRLLRRIPLRLTAPTLFSSPPPPLSPAPHSPYFRRRLARTIGPRLGALFAGVAPLHMTDALLTGADRGGRGRRGKVGEWGTRSFGVREGGADCDSRSILPSITFRLKASRSHRHRNSCETGTGGAAGV